MVFCNQNGIRVNAYCDNNIALQGQEKFGYRIISPIELKNTICEKNEVVVLTMKEGAEGVVRQLTEKKTVGKKEKEVFNNGCRFKGLSYK